MKKIRVLIVDDEPRAHKILENYIARRSDLELVDSAYNAVAAHSFLKFNQVDLLFLDVTMPEIDGFGLLKMLDNLPFIIFTTAHSEFAAESYEYSAVDYLKKPFSFERFSKGIDKLVQWIEKGIRREPEKKVIDLKIDGSIHTIPFEQILYIQSLGNYVKIFLNNKRLVTQVTTVELESTLPKSSFLRVHKSFIVNKMKINKVLEEELLIGSIRIPIGKTFKKYVKELAITK